MIYNYSLSLGVNANFFYFFPGTKIEAGLQRTRTSSSTTTHTNQDISGLLLESLDPHLRPATPDYSDPKSVELYEEHQKLAEEYWKVKIIEQSIDSDLAYRCRKEYLLV